MLCFHGLSYELVLVLLLFPLALFDVLITKKPLQGRLEQNRREKFIGGQQCPLRQAESCQWEAKSHIVPH